MIRRMRISSRFALAAGALTVSLGLSGAPAIGKAVLDGPVVQAEHAESRTPNSAALLAKVGGGNEPATYHFEYGPSAAYGTSTPEQVAPAADHPQWVREAVLGLSPATRYHFRVVASNSLGTTSGADRTFKTQDPPPVLGRTVVTTPVSGTVKIKVPGAHGSKPLGAVSAIPAGSEIDASHGRVSVSTALPAGRQQTGTFWGGAFRIRQARTGRGLTDLYLTGPALGRCPRASHAKSGAASISRARRRRRSLWGHDRHGRFRTHGANSVATVRGTVWGTEDTCAGTLTVVRQGSVMVRDNRRHRNVLVRAGHRYLARPAR
jgi:hypothetical protein